MPLVDWLQLHLRVGSEVGNDGLTAAERRRLAAEYQAGAAAKPTAAEMHDLRAAMVALSRRQQPPPPA